MNEYPSRSEISPVDRVPARPATAVSAVQSTSVRIATPEQGAAAARIAIANGNSASLDGDVAGAAEYAKVHARIADILADLRSETATLDIDGAAEAMQSMLPPPIIMVPLPPASKEAVEHAAQFAKRMAQQAVYAHSAQAHVKRGTVDQILSANA